MRRSRSPIPRTAWWIGHPSVERPSEAAEQGVLSRPAPDIRSMALGRGWARARTPCSSCPTSPSGEPLRGKMCCKRHTLPGILSAAQPSPTANAVASVPDLMYEGRLVRRRSGGLLPRRRRTAGENMNAPMRCGLQPALAGMVFVMAGVLAVPPARTEEDCRSRCWETYGACYRSTSNRERCQGQLLRCLNNCIRANRRPASVGPESPRAAPPRGPDPGRGKIGPSPPNPTAPLFLPQ
jgi:hypothetical protein